MLLQISLLVIVLTSVYFFLCKKTKKLKGIVLPGPKGWPLVGSIFELNDRNIHFKFMDYADKFGKIFCVNLLGRKVVALNTQEIIRKAFGGENHKEAFSDREEMFYGQHFRGPRKSPVVITDGTCPYFKAVKRGMMQALHTYGSGLKDLENNVMVEMENFLKQIQNQPTKEFECVDMFQRSLSNVISLVLTGETLSENDPDSALFWAYVQNADFFMNAQVNAVTLMCPFVRFIPGQYRTRYLSTKKAVAEIGQRYFYDVKKTFNAGKIRGVVDHYIDIQRNEKSSAGELFYTDDQIIADVLDIIHGGTTTTLSALSNSVLILLNYPQYQRKLQEEFDSIIGRNRMPAYTDREHCKFFKAFELEMFRFIPVVPLLLPHVCRYDVELEGFHVDENSTVFGNIWYVHHNKEIWGDPWVFRPERFLDEQGNLLPKEHTLLRNVMPFGYGPRHCPGEGFARTRYFLYIASLLQRLDLEFPEGKFRSCDPRQTENFEIKEICRSLPFFCRFKERQ